MHGPERRGKFKFMMRVIALLASPLVAYLLVGYVPEHAARALLESMRR